MKRTMPLRLYAWKIIFTISVFFINNVKLDSICSSTGNYTCVIVANISEMENQQVKNIHWNNRPQNVGFNYYLQTSENGEELTVRGILTWKINMNKSSEPKIDGFRVTIYDITSNLTVAEYVLFLQRRKTQDSLKTPSKHEIIEVRLNVNNILQFEKQYEAKVELLPLGEQVRSSATVGIIANSVEESCPTKNGLIDRWAPHVAVDVLEVNSELNITFKPAPSFLCIKSYEVLVQTKDRNIINQTEIEVPIGNNLANVFFEQIPRSQLITVKVRAKNSRVNGCACTNCKCITDKTDYFKINETYVPVTARPIDLNANITQPTEHSNWNLLLALSILFVVLLIILMITCFVTKKYNPTIRRRLFLKTINSRNVFGNFGGNKSYKILLICPNATGEEDQYLQRICQGLHVSKNRVACDKFDEFASIVEQNMLQWIYKESAMAEKIIIFHASETNGVIGVYDILTTFFPANDNRLIHVNLSPGVKHDHHSEIEFVLPRDELIFEKAFNMKIPQQLQPSPPPPPVEVKPFAETTYKVCFENMTESQKNDTIDSGMSSMSIHSSEMNDSLGNTLRSQCEKQLNELELEERPLLHQPIAV